MGNAHPVRFDAARLGDGEQLQLTRGGRGMRIKGNGFCLTTPVFNCGRAAATIRIDDQPRHPADLFKNVRMLENIVLTFGVFPADLKLDSSYDERYKIVYKSDSKRCALQVGGREGGFAQMMGNGALPARDARENLAWRRGDRIHVSASFEAGVARITIRFKGRTESRVLEDVPECGLCFGIGLHTLSEGPGAGAAWCNSLNRLVKPLQEKGIGVSLAASAPLRWWLSDTLLVWRGWRSAVTEDGWV